MEDYIRWDASSPNKCTSMASEKSKIKYTYILLSSKLPTIFSTRAGADDCVEPARATKYILSLLQVITIRVPTWKIDQTISLKIVWSVNLRLWLPLTMIMHLLLQDAWETLICKHVHFWFSNQVLTHCISTKSTKALWQVLKRETTRKKRD